MKILGKQHWRIFGSKNRETSSKTHQFGNFSDTCEMETKVTIGPAVFADIESIVEVADQMH